MNNKRLLFNEYIPVFMFIKYILNNDRVKCYYGSIMRELVEILEILNDVLLDCELLYSRLLKVVLELEGLINERKEK